MKMAIPISFRFEGDALFIGIWVVRPRTDIERLDGGQCWEIGFSAQMDRPGSTAEYVNPPGNIWEEIAHTLQNADCSLEVRITSLEICFLWATCSSENREAFREGLTHWGLSHPIVIHPNPENLFNCRSGSIIYIQETVAEGDRYNLRY
jgi:hypothetical protein